MERFARLGYAARGLVYAIVAWFAVLAATGDGQATDTEGALVTVLRQPFGKVMLGVLAAGLFCYAAWRVMQGAFDADHRGRGAKAVVARIAFLVSAAVYAGLAVTAVSLIMGGGGSNGSGSGGGGESGSAALADQAVAILGGQVFAALLALVFLGAAVAHAVKAFRHDFERRLRCDPETMDRVRPVAMAGLLARGAVFLVFAGLMGWRALQAGGSSEPPQLIDALRAVQGLPFGTVLLLFVGLGLMAYAAYSFVQAAYRHIDLPDTDDVRRAVSSHPRGG